MANDQRGEIVVNIGGEDRILRLSTHAARSIERAMGGRSMIGMVQGGIESINTDLILYVLYFGLKLTIPGLSERQVEDWCDDARDGLNTYAEPVIKAILLYQGGAKAEAAYAKAKADAERGLAKLPPIVAATPSQPPPTQTTTDGTAS